jgi:predicted Rossmann fold flavoprotein
MICIIGGGASGMMAGIAAGQAGGRVVLLERNKRLGKKLLVTGNGRCNFTNTRITVDNYHGQDPAFVQGALRRFTHQETLDFFTHLGVVPEVEEETGKIFPASGQAGSILDLLRWELEALGVQVRTEAQVERIELKDKFNIYLADGQRLQAGKLILATGGKAHPQSGSDGAGLEFAKKLGHRIIPPRPALVQLKLRDIPGLRGIKIQGQATLLLGDTQLATETGQLLFTNYGISGLPALALSREAGKLLAQGKRPLLSLNLAPQVKIEETIRSRVLSQPSRPLGRIFVGWLPNKVGEALVRAAEIPAAKPSQSLTDLECQRLVKLTADWRFPITGLLGWEQAQVTAGGVDVSQVDPATLESRLVKNLFFTGEILDIDGDSGGYNLQWAWSSGFLAGIRAV